MNDPRPFFAFYPEDFWSSEAVEQMSFEAAGVYLFLLSRQWTAGSLPADATVLRRLCRGRAEEFDRHWPGIAALFPAGPDGRLRNPRLEREREVADRHSALQSGRAKARWERWRTEHPGGTGGAKKADSDAAAVPRQSRGNASAMQGQGQGQRQDIQKPPLPPSGGAASEPAADSGRKAVDAVLDEPEFKRLSSHPTFAAFWPEWLAHRRQTKHPYKLLGAREALRQALKYGPEVWIEAARQSMASGWQGVFPEKVAQQQQHNGVPKSESAAARAIAFSRAARGELPNGLYGSNP